MTELSFNDRFKIIQSLTLFVLDTWDKESDAIDLYNDWVSRNKMNITDGEWAHYLIELIAAKRNPHTKSKKGWIIDTGVEDGLFASYPI